MKLAMLAMLIHPLMILATTGFVCSVLYPLSVLVVGQGLFPSRASGDIVTGPDGKPLAGLVGSEPQVNVLEVNLQVARRLR